MHSKIHPLIQQLSSKSVAERKKAVRELARHITSLDGYLARLSLHYVSVHDPSYTVRNLARQAFYRIGSPPPEDHVWDRAHIF